MRNQVKQPELNDRDLPTTEKIHRISGTAGINLQSNETETLSEDNSDSSNET